MLLLEELALLLEFQRFSSAIAKAVKDAVSVPITLRAGIGKNLTIVADAPRRGQEGADNVDRAQILDAVEAELSRDYRVERDTGDESLDTLKVYGNGKVSPLLQTIRVSIKPFMRSKHDGDWRMERRDLKIDSKIDKPGEANELMLVRLIEQALEHNDGHLDELIFNGSNDVEIIFENIVAVKHVGGENQKADVILIDEDGEAHAISVKQRDFFEIDAGADLINELRPLLVKEIEKAVEEESASLDHEGKLSKSKHFELAVKLTPLSAKRAYFGGDVEAVVIETFLAKDFAQLKGSIVKVSCDHVARNTKELHRRLWPYISINSDFEKGARAKPIIGKIHASIVPRFRLNPLGRASGFAKTKLLDIEA